MESVCYVPSYFLFNIAMAFIVVAPFAATRLLVLRMRFPQTGPSKWSAGSCPPSQRRLNETMAKEEFQVGAVRANINLTRKRVGSSVRSIAASLILILLPVAAERTRPE